MQVKLRNCLATNYKMVFTKMRKTGIGLMCKYQGDP